MLALSLPAAARWRESSTGRPDAPEARDAGMPDPDMLSASGVRFARPQTPGTLRDLRRVVDAVFPED